MTINKIFKQSSKCSHSPPRQWYNRQWRIIQAGDGLSPCLLHHGIHGCTQLWCRFFLLIFWCDVTRAFVLNNLPPSQCLLRSPRFKGSCSPYHISQCLLRSPWFKGSFMFTYHITSHIIMPTAFPSIQRFIPYRHIHHINHTISTDLAPCKRLDIMELCHTLALTITIYGTSYYGPLADIDSFMGPARTKRSISKSISGISRLSQHSEADSLMLQVSHSNLR